MARRRKKGQKRESVYQRRFEDSDLVWLAGRFEGEARLNPDLTVEEFAMRHGVQAELISPFMVKGMSTVSVWHGTTVDKARSIMEEGFKARGSTRKKIWFTMKPAEAHSIANHRAQQRDKSPVIFRCEIN